MQIRYLEAMQAMAKSANSKVIFLPAANQTMPGLQDAVKNAKPYAEEHGEGSSFNAHDFGSGHTGFDQAINARVIENI